MKLLIFRHFTSVIFFILFTNNIANAKTIDLLKIIKTRGILNVAMEGNYPPFNFKDLKTNKLTGFDVDFAKLLATQLGVKPVFLTAEWSGILAGLAVGKYDVIINHVGITYARKKVFDFSNPYALSKPQLILRKNEKRQFYNLNDLKGTKLGLGQGTNYEQQAKNIRGINVKSYPSSAEYLTDLVNGHIDAVLNDSLLINYLLNTTYLPIKSGPCVGNVEQIGIPFHKDNPVFQTALNNALSEIQKNGSFQQIFQKWFGIHPNYVSIQE